MVLEINMTSRFFDAFIQGLSGSALYASHELTKISKVEKTHSDQRTDAEKLQSDWRKIGGDFHVSIDRIQRSDSR
jgi:hypothetical protein